MSAARYIQLTLVLLATAFGGSVWALSCAQDLNGNGVIDTASEAGTCVATPQGDLCPIGAVNCTTERCPLDPAAACTNGQCSAPQACVAVNGGYQCPADGSVYADQMACDAGCVQTAACTSTAPTCPLDANLTCMDSGNGVFQCSPNQCVNFAGDPSTNPDVTTVTIDNSLPDNSGPRNSEGLCVGSLSIFAGRAMDCKKAGLRSGFHDCCDDGTGLVPDSTGGEIGTLVGQQITSTVASFGIKALTSVGRQLYFNYIVGGAGHAELMFSAAEIGTNAISSAASSVLTLSTLYFAAASIIVQYFLIPNCSQIDLETATLAESKMCHYIGTYCSEKWKFIGCVQKKASYCCFNSMLARIVQEQGRPQLASFASLPGGIWGSPGAPQCRGFSPEEFQNLDFGSMNLTEYFGYIQQVAQDTINAGEPQSNLNNAIQTFYNGINP